MTQRYRLFRSVFIAFVLLAHTVGVGAARRSDTDQGFRETLQRARDIGLPTSSHELLPDSSPVEDNAAPLYLRVIDLAKKSPRVRLEGLLTPSEDTRKQIDEWKGILDLVEQAAGKKRCLFSGELDSQDVFLLASTCHLICARAVLRSREGDTYGALDDIHGAIGAAEALREEPYLMSQIVRITICNTVVTALEIVLPYCDSAVEAIEKIKLPTVQGAVLMGLRDQIVGCVQSYEHQFLEAEFYSKTTSDIMKGPLLKPGVTKVLSLQVDFLCDYAELLASPYTVSVPAALTLEGEKIQATGLLGEHFHMQMGSLIEKEALVESRLSAARLAAHLIDHEKLTGQRIQRLEELGEIGKLRDPLTTRPYGVKIREGTRQLESSGRRDAVWTFHPF